VELQTLGELRECGLRDVAPALGHDSDQVRLSRQATVRFERIDCFELAGGGFDRALEIGRFGVDDAIEVASDCPRDLARFELQQRRSPTDESEERAESLGALPRHHPPVATEPP